MVQQAEGDRNEKEPGHEFVELIAVCSALTINTVPDYAQEAKPLAGEGAAMAAAAGLDVADWWEPTAASYLGAVSKDHILSVVADVGFAKEANGQLGKLKKGELVVQAETLLARPALAVGVAQAACRRVSRVRAGAVNPGSCGALHALVFSHAKLIRTPIRPRSAAC